LRRVLFDHNVPSPLARFLRAYEIKLADEMGWATFQNGQLLSAAERAGFEVLLSGDQTIKYEQSMTGRKIRVVSMSDNHWPIVKDYVDAILKAVATVNPGEIKPVFCGRFRPQRMRKPEAKGTKFKKQTE
jgi:hypothetical protein